MKIFVTGGSSYLGQNMIPYLSSKGYDICHTWYSTPPSGSFPGHAVQVDVRDAKHLNSLVTEFRPAAIIHLAASNRSNNEASMISSIIEGAKAITKIAETIGCRLIHMSSDVVFDGTKKLYFEDTPVSPPHVYGKAKAEAECIVGRYSNSVIIRPSLIYGLKIKDRSTEWIEASLEAGNEVTLFTDQIRMPVWVNTLADVCLELISHDYSGILHVVGNQQLSRAEMGQKMLDWWNIQNREFLRFTPMPSQAVWPKDLMLDTSLAKRILTTPLLGVDEVIGQLF